MADDTHDDPNNDEAIDFVLGNRPFATAVQEARGKHDGYYEIDRNEILRVAKIIDAYRKLLKAYNRIEQRYQITLTAFLVTIRELELIKEELRSLREKIMDNNAQEDEVD